MTAADLQRYWPLFGLRLRVHNLELRVPRDDDVATLAALAARGVHPPERMPFLTPWTDKPPGELERGVLQWHWRARGEWSPDNWSFDFVVVHDGEVVGAQGMSAVKFAIARTVTTGSWLGQAYQGRGIGKLMRSAALALAFDGLGALEAHSGAFTDNPASRRVSEALGYRRNGYEVVVVRGERKIEERFAMTLEDWRAQARP